MWYCPIFLWPPCKEWHVQYGNFCCCKHQVRRATIQKSKMNWVDRLRKSLLLWEWLTKQSSFGIYNTEITLFISKILELQCLQKSLANYCLSSKRDNFFLGFWLKLRVDLSLWSRMPLVTLNSVASPSNFNPDRSMILLSSKSQVVSCMNSMLLPDVTHPVRSSDGGIPPSVLIID